MNYQPVNGSLLFNGVIGKPAFGEIFIEHLSRNVVFITPNSKQKEN